MNPVAAYGAGQALWSFRKEFTTVFLIILLLLSLPVVAVIATATAGIDKASEVLANLNPEKRLVQLFDPKGLVFKEFTPEVRWPAEGPITAEFGIPHEPWEKHHTGIDIADKDGKNGQLVYPMMAGKVVGVYEQNIGLGKHIVVDHGDNVTTVYGHLQEFKVSKGSEAKIDQPIGVMDDTGYSTGPHVHFMVKVFGIPINPRTFLGAAPPEKKEGEKKP